MNNHHYSERIKTKPKLILALSLFMLSTTFGQWYQQFTGDPHKLISIYFVDENNGYAAGYEGTVLITTNGGEIWNSLSLGGTDFFHDIKFSDEQNGWAAFGGWTPGRHGRILHTTNGGESWIASHYESGAVFLSVHFVDDLNGWAVGTSGIIIHTTNGGLTWDYQFAPLSGEWLYEVYFSDQNNGWAVGNLGSQILKTTDGGNNWQSVFFPLFDWLTGVEFLDQNIGVAVGDNGRILKSTDGGNSWFTVLSGTSVTLRDIHFVDSNIVWAVGLGGVVLKSNDQGSTWTSIESGSTVDLYSVCFVNQDQGWIAADFETILHTENGGLPVELVSFNASLSGNKVELSWITSSEINNQGFEIQRRFANSEFTPIGFIQGHGSTTELNHYSFSDLIETSDNYFYRLKQIDYDGTFEYSNEVMVEYLEMNFKLHQNFPNPFNPSTTITFSLPVNGNVKLSVFNSLGEEVAILANEEISTGTHSFNFDAINFSSGIYFYRINVEGEDGSHWTESKKMILIK